MFNPKYWSVLILFVFLAACGGGPERRNTYVQDINGLRSKMDSMDRELSAGIKPVEPGARPPIAAQPVKTLKRTAEVYEFESEGVGSSSKYERPIDAEKRAEEDALSKAVKESGVNVYSGFQDVLEESSKVSYQFIGKYINIWSSGLVSYERDGLAACSLAGGTHRCSVKIRGKVYFKGDPDPNFELQAALDKPAYFDGDNVTLKVRLTKDAYITLLNCDEDGNITLIFPNRHARDNFLPAGKELDIPGDLFQLKALLPPGRPETGEILHVIATKSQPLVLVDALKEEKTGIFTSYPLGGIKVLVTKLAKFNRADWTAQVLFYGVKSK